MRDSPGLHGDHGTSHFDRWNACHQGVIPWLSLVRLAIQGKPPGLHGDRVTTHFHRWNVCHLGVIPGLLWPRHTFQLTTKLLLVKRCWPRPSLWEELRVSLPLSSCSELLPVKVFLVSLVLAKRDMGKMPFISLQTNYSWSRFFFLP